MSTASTGTADPYRANGWKAFWDRGGFWRAILLAVSYLAIYLSTGFVIGHLVDVDTDNLFSSAQNVFWGVAAAIIVGIVVLLLFGKSIRWLSELFGKQPELSRHWWMWIPPIVLLACNILRFAGTDYNPFDGATIATVLFAGLCIGFAEELLTRGYVVNLMRRGGYKEWTVMFVSALVFSSLHMANIISGQDVTVVAGTVVYTFFFGICMYLTLRVTGNLIWPLLLHATTDPSAMLATGGIDKITGTKGLSATATLGLNAGNILAIVFGLIFMWFVRGQVSRLHFAGSKAALTATPEPIAP
jgi:hypothetical protein